MSSAPPLRIADRVRAERRAGFVGRAAELDRLAAAARDDGPVVTFVLGIGGIGKTSLLDALGERLDRDAVPWRRLDCESVEPTPSGLLAALGAAFGTPMATVDAAAAALAAMGPRVVLALDQYECFRLLDAWLRQELVPALPASVRVFLFGRHAPVDAWMAAPGWSGLVQTLRLATLGDGEARAWLARQPLSAPVRDRVLWLCAGHPLALSSRCARWTWSTGLKVAFHCRKPRWPGDPFGQPERDRRGRSSTGGEPSARAVGRSLQAPFARPNETFARYIMDALAALATLEPGLVGGEERHAPQGLGEAVAKLFSPVSPLYDAPLTATRNGLRAQGPRAYP